MLLHLHLSTIDIDLNADYHSNSEMALMMTNTHNNLWACIFKKNQQQVLALVIKWEECKCVATDVGRGSVGWDK